MTPTLAQLRKRAERLAWRLDMRVQLPRHYSPAGSLRVELLAQTDDHMTSVVGVGPTESAALRALIRKLAARLRARVKANVKALEE